MSRPGEVIRFLRNDPAALLAVLEDLAERRDGWVNLQPYDDPDADPDAPPARSGMFGLITARGPQLPVSTWVPGERTAKGTEADSVGIQHAAGPRALRRLLAAGVEPPEGSSLLSDHPRRGLVVRLAPGTAPRAVLEWLFAASDELAPRPPPDTWVAVVHRRGGR